MKNIEELTAKIIASRDTCDRAQFYNPKDAAISLSLEAAEFLEHFQWKNPEEVKKHLETHKTEVSEELAKVLLGSPPLSRPDNRRPGRPEQKTREKRQKIHRIKSQRPPHQVHGAVIIVCSGTNSQFRQDVTWRTA